MQTRAVRDGEHYLVNGSKIWTTGAHLANRMFAIVRTGASGRPQEGLAFLLLDMRTPGIEVRPIPDLNGAHEFNQVFFRDVAVPVANRVGPENDGWTVAKRLMQMARSNNTPSALVRRTLRRTARLAADAGLSRDPDVARRLAALSIELDAFARIELAALPDGRPDAREDALPSMLKLIGTELHQRVTELMLEIAAPHGAPVLHEDAPAGDAAAKYFAVRAATIYSGSSETQRNVIARTLGIV